MLWSFHQLMSCTKLIVYSLKSLKTNSLILALKFNLIHNIPFIVDVCKGYFNHLHKENRLSLEKPEQQYEAKEQRSRRQRVSILFLQQSSECMILFMNDVAEFFFIGYS